MYLTPKNKSKLMVSMFVKNDYRLAVQTKALYGIAIYQLYRYFGCMINGEPINRVSVAKYVGMYIDENLKWDVHIDKIIPKISGKISILRFLRNLEPIDILTLMYNAIVLPHFDYADIVLDSASAASKFKLQWLSQYTCVALLTDNDYLSIPV